MDGEEAQKFYANNVVLHNAEALRKIVMEQMQILIKNGVVPTWKNFKEYGKGWYNIKKLLNKEAEYRYYEIWNKTYREIENE